MGATVALDDRGSHPQAPDREDRRDALDGVMTVTSPPGAGTVIDVELPRGS